MKEIKSLNCIINYRGVLCNSIIYGLMLSNYLDQLGSQDTFCITERLCVLCYFIEQNKIVRSPLKVRISLFIYLFSIALDL